MNNQFSISSGDNHHPKYDYDDDPLQQFTYALRASETKRQYPKRLKVFMDFAKIEGDLNQQSGSLKKKIQSDNNWFRISLIQFFEFQKERARRNDIAFSTISNYYKAIKLFVDMNFDNPVVNWKKVSKGIPSGRKAANDRAPTIDELKKLSEYPDRRIKSIVYLMASSGIRLGAFDTLRWKDVTPIYNESEKELIAAKLVVYSGENEQYFTFMTPEAYRNLKNWINYRKSHGENITGNSWLMRDLWQTTEMNYGTKFGVATYPRQLKSLGIKSLLERALRAQGLVQPLDKKKNERRTEWKGAHGLRKFYQTTAERVMKSINVEITMGHQLGAVTSSYKPSEKDVLDDYLKAVDLLTINFDETGLRKTVQKLEEENKNIITRLYSLYFENLSKMYSVVLEELGNIIPNSSDIAAKIKSRMYKGHFESERPELFPIYRTARMCRNNEIEKELYYVLDQLWIRNEDSCKLLYSLDLELKFQDKHFISSRKNDKLFEDKDRSRILDNETLKKIHLLIDYYIYQQEKGEEEAERDQFDAEDTYTPFD